MSATRSSSRTTRSGTAAASASASAKVTPAPAAPKSRANNRKASSSQQHQQRDDASMDVEEDGKENVKEGSKSSSAASKSASVKMNGVVSGKKMKAPLSSRKSLKPVDCICSKGDDGSPMIHCSECKIWYHFTCVDISEPDAEEINVYICPTCTQATGRRSAMHWEGDQAIEECSEDEAAIVERRNAILKSRKQHSTESHPKPIKYVDLDESDGGEDSEDEYIEEKDDRGRHSEKRASRLRRLSSGSESREHSPDEAGGEGKRRRLSRVKPDAGSPSPSVQYQHQHQLKRKANNTNVGGGGARGQTETPPPSKRKRSGTNSSANAFASTSDPADDPVRKYCLSKLEEMFKEVFFRYPHVRVRAKTDGDADMDENDDKTEVKEQEEDGMVQKKLEELSEEEKEALVEQSRQFSRDLEGCVFEIYSEPDKVGYPQAAGKYKDRFRMLQFNLSKPDRVVIHQRITSGNISAKEISLMSSTDLADEETKQSIKLAEKEALEHSILLKAAAPRAKITHKGLQDIEDVNGETVSAREQERQTEREQEEDERREREKMARFRMTGPNRQRTSSMSMPPESPTTMQQTPTGEVSQQQQWGGPPPVPLHAMAASTSEDGQHPQRPPLFIHSSTDFGASNIPEPELNLADLINIDEEQEGGAKVADAATSPLHPSLGPNFVASPIEGVFPPNSPLSAATTGISPFAHRPERGRGPSFDLNSLWNMPKDEPAAGETSTEPSITTGEGDTTSGANAEDTPEGSDKDENMELESIEANDQDFDMFLDEPVQEEPLIISNIEHVVEDLPEVWSGKITMPLDSSVPQETTLIARQIGGKPLASDSPLWKTLFPTDVLRIEGRVPIENSVKYLLQMRMNATKELYATAFVPSSRENEEDFKVFCNFLISKSRHGLVFPWGSRPKDYHPGRELYMIPLLQSQALPDFIELLDDLKVPKTRSRDYLIGIWILNKGKLAPLPGPTSHSITPAQLPEPVQTSPSHQPSPLVNIPTYNKPPSGDQVPPFGAPPSAPPPAGMPIASSALIEEVASLTPEQIQNLLRTLAATTQIPLPPVSQAAPPLSQHPLQQFNQPPPSHVPVPPVSQHTPPVHQPWMQHPPPPAPYPMNFPPPNVPFRQPMPQPHNMNAPPPNIPYDRPYDDRNDYDYDRNKYEHDFQPVPHSGYGQTDGHRGSDRGDRGRRGNNNNRDRGGGSRGGRGRGRGDGYQGQGDRDFNTRRDAGWPRRSRNEGQGGPSW